MPQPSARRLLDSAQFWAALGALPLAVGAVLVAVGAGDASSSHTSVWSKTMFVIGFIMLAAGAIAGFWSLVLFLAHRHAQQHIDAGSAPAHADPRRRDRRLDLLNHKRVGEELDAEGDIPEAAAQIWTDSVLAFLRTRGVVRRWFPETDVVNFLSAGSGTNRQRMRARLDVLDDVVEGLGRRSAIRRPRWLSGISIGSVTVEMAPVQVRLERSLESASQETRTAALENIGIVVVSATWGHPTERERRADVTAKLNDLVDSNGELRFDVEVDVLEDPIFGVQKTLEIVYRVGSERRIKEATFREHERVDLPDRSSS